MDKPNVEITGQGDDANDAGGDSVRRASNPVSSQLYVGVVNNPADSERYYMKHKYRGVCLIFNNKTFQPHTQLNERRGTDVDKTLLWERFQALDFDVKIFDDFSKKQILDTIKEASKMDHTFHDCFACCFLTHGDVGVLYGSDGKFAPTDILTPFLGDKCPSLVGKPKLFFIQACQGDQFDSGSTLYCNDAPDSYHAYKIPVHADFLIAYSTIPGFYSWRNTTEGSWFVRALCKVLQEHGRTKDLLSMLTFVNRKVAFEFESNVPKERYMDRKKQIPCINSMLTREVYFPLKSTFV